MRILLKKIGRIFAMHWAENIQYRTDMIMWTLAGAITPLISLAIWRREEFTVAETVNLWEPKILKTVIITKEEKPLELVHWR
jgi:ABC-type uncharacterized transport system permease subunit